MFCAVTCCVLICCGRAGGGGVGWWGLQGPASEQQLTVQAFASFYSKVCALNGAGHATEVSLHERGFRFSAQFTDEYQLFAMYVMCVLS